MNRELVSKFHNQQVGDKVFQQWLYLTPRGYELDIYSGARGGAESTTKVSKVISERIKYLHSQDKSY